MKTRFDIHCHLFNKHFLSSELYYRLIMEIRHFLDLDEKWERGLTREPEEERSRLAGMIDTVKRFVHFLHAGLRDDSIGVYGELLKVYGDEPFVITPLMFDLTYCFTGGDRELTTGEDLQQIFHDQLAELNRRMDLLLPERLRKTRSIKSPEKEQKLCEEMNSLRKEFDRLIGELEETRRTGRDLTRGPSENDGFNLQRKELMALKNRPGYRNRVFPFLSVDPRRPGITDLVHELVGKGKDFSGIKLYTSNGYSPTDPVLFAPGGIFEYCSDNGIPVTAHNSSGGFATFAQRVRINGYYYDASSGKPMKIESGWVEFEHPITKFGPAVAERALALNHPRLWEIVLDRYPELYLNLAHFGGGEELRKAILNPDDQSSWSNILIRLIRENDHTFTDLSCFSEFDVLKLFHDHGYFTDKKLRNRILFGTDFYLLLLFDMDYTRYISDFTDNLGKSVFDLISQENPLLFLERVLPQEFFS